MRSRPSPKRSTNHYGPAVIFAAATGLRPAEWIGLEWRNVDREHRVVYVEQAVVGGEKTRTTTKNSLRAVPLTDHALAALDAVQRRDLSTRYVFTTKTGLPIDLHVWRHRHWNPAVEAAGLHADEDGTRRRRPPYALRHTFATLALRQGPLDVRGRPVHGDERRDDRPALREPRAGLDGSRAHEAEQHRVGSRAAEARGRVMLPQ
jgi:integrase